MNYEELMNTYNSANPFANTVGVRVTTVRDGYAEAEVPIASLHGNTIRSLGSTAPRSRESSTTSGRPP